MLRMRSLTLQRVLTLLADRRLSEITDGLSETLNVIEVPSEQSVPWMSPNDADEQLLISIGAKSKLAHAHGMDAVLGKGTFLPCCRSLSEQNQSRGAGVVTQSALTAGVAGVRITLHCKATCSIPDPTGMLMALIARIIGLSLIMSGLGAGLGLAFFGRSPDWSGVSLLLACAGGIIGAITGAAREIVTALRRQLSS